MVNPIQMYPYHIGPGKLVSWVFLHGELEEKYGFDLLRCQEELPQEPGVYEALVGDTECQLYFWHPPDLPEPKGLVVAKGDKEAIAYAQQCYTTKAISA